MQGRSKILTHRSLEPQRSNFFSESSYEGFRDHLARGFGIEFDASPLADGNIVITHDRDLKRITKGKDLRTVVSLNTSDIQSLQLERGRLAFFQELMSLIKVSTAPFSALHLKGVFQERKYLELIAKHLIANRDLASRLIIFDVNPESVNFLKQSCPEFNFAPSVAHPYDIARYNACMNGTLLSLEQAIGLRHLYSWVWLDEWDRSNKDGESKIFYSAATFETLRRADFKIALVTPELHASSPGLLGSEMHADAKNLETLFNRIQQIVSLQPDLVCTDYPEECAKLFEKNL